MENYKEAFVAFLQENNVKFQDINDRVVTLSWASKKVPNGIKVLVAFDQDNNHGVHFVCNGFAVVPEEKLGAVLMACNGLNKLYRWFKFYIDDDMDVMVEDDAIVDIESVGKECLELILRMVNVVGDAYDPIMKAIYS